MFASAALSTNARSARHSLNRKRHQKSIRNGCTLKQHVTKWRRWLLANATFPCTQRARFSYHLHSGADISEKGSIFPFSPNGSFDFGAATDEYFILIATPIRSGEVDANTLAAQCGAHSSMAWAQHRAPYSSQLRNECHAAKRMDGNEWRSLIGRRAIKTKRTFLLILLCAAHT